MGELAKKIGEYGEKLVVDFLKEIGWFPLEDCQSFDCFLPMEHSRSKKKGTHGKDLGLTYNSPLVDGELVDLFISVKFSKNKYEDNPRGKFHKHFKDLAYGLECYSKSSLRSERLSNFDYFSHTKTIGILFWLNNDPQDSDDSLLAELSKSRFSDNYSFDQIIVFTNRSYSFITRCIKEIKLISFNKEILFHYPSTGNNINPSTRKLFGNILPVEFLTSDILLFKVEQESLWHLYICSNQNFNVSDFKRLVGLSIQLSSGWAKKVVITFPNYDELDHSNLVNIALQSFQEDYVIRHTKCLQI